MRRACCSGGCAGGDTGGVTCWPELADRLALALVEQGPRSGSDLALALGVRKQTVLHELRTADRFERVGRGRSSAWRLVGTGREPLYGDGSLDRDEGVAVALAALERRLAVVEARLGLAGAPGIGMSTTER